MKIFEEEIRYPQKGDKFFIEQGNPEEIAILNKAFQKFGNYADSYQTSALSLLDIAIADQKVKDYHIYPASFLIRHYFELRLKELIQGINYCTSQENIFPTHHVLRNLWGEFKKAYKALGEDANDANFQVIDELIKEMELVDPISMAFRYPVNKEGQAIQKLESVNLVNLRETLIKVCFVFDSVAMQIAHYVEMTEDMMMEVYRNYE